MHRVHQGALASIRLTMYRESSKMAKEHLKRRSRYRFSRNPEVTVKSLNAVSAGPIESEENEDIRPLVMEESENLPLSQEQEFIH